MPDSDLVAVVNPITKNVFMINCVTPISDIIIATFTNDTTSYEKMYLPVVGFRMRLDNIHFEHFVEAVVVAQSEMSNVILKTLIA